MKKFELKQHKRSIPDELLVRAKDLYMGFESVSEIARMLEVNRTTLQYYVRKSWKEERDLLSSEFISSITSSRASDLASIQSSSIKILKKSLLNMANRAEPPSSKEALDAVKILESMDKLAKANPDEYPSHGEHGDVETIDLDIVDPFSSLEGESKDD